jgi:EmrB/QacA subfamily drug resistance transporter
MIRTGGNMTETTATPALTNEIQGRWVLIATILASSMAFIDGTALNVALPALQADFSATGAELLWVVNAYLLMLAALVLIGGALGDRLGRKRVFFAGICVFMLGSLACGLAPGVGWLILFRILQGSGGALMIPGSLAIIAAYFPPSTRGKAIGTWSAATTIVTVIGPVLGGVLADAGLWRGVFLINLPLGLFALWILVTHVPESRDDTVSAVIDYPGAALVAVGLAGLTYGFLAAPERGFGHPGVYGTLFAGGLALILFVLVEMRSRHPMLPLQLFRSATFSGANLLTFFLYGALNAAVLFLSLNLVQAQGYSQSFAGIAFLPFSLLLTLLSRWAGGLVDRIGPRLPLIAGPLMAGIGFVLMALVGETSGPSSYWTTFFPGIVVFGIGMGITVAPLTTTVMSSVATHYSGTASGINNAVARTAGVLTIAILGAVALLAFQNYLTARTSSLSLTAGQHGALMQEARQLGETSAPANMGPQQAPLVENAIRGAFIDTYQLVLWICAAMGLTSALMSVWLIRGRLVDQG